MRIQFCRFCELILTRRADMPSCRSVSRALNARALAEKPLDEEKPHEINLHVKQNLGGANIFTSLLKQIKFLLRP